MTTQSQKTSFFYISYFLRISPHFGWENNISASTGSTKNKFPKTKCNYYETWVDNYL
jgi:hypothetical protein